jgi:hypothetical protein
MFWLASYPRSGNTFFRVIMSQVYGIESSELVDPILQRNHPEYLDYQMVKTHLLPDQIEPTDKDIPAVYLIRDGRDAVVSTARMATQIIDPSGPDYLQSLQNAIRAQEGTFYGGWSKHVRMWRQRACLVIRFEDLIQDPITHVEKIRQFYPLPEPNLEMLPTFDDLRTRPKIFNSESTLHGSMKLRHRFFRRGKVGAWKDEMPINLQMLFYAKHGLTLWREGYVSFKPKLSIERLLAPRAGKQAA